MIDLHTHSTASDGILSPKELALYVSEKNISTWALTDHDTVSGLSDAAKTCSTLGINFIPGIELNIEWNTGEFHLLGLGLCRISPELQEVIDFLTESRENRNRIIIQKMNDAGFDFTLEQIKEAFPFSQLGRPHFAEFFVQKGIAKNRQEVFAKYLANGRAWYAAHQGVNLEKAVHAVKTSGGVAVLAHPMSLYVSWKNMPDVIAKIRDTGVMGLEAFHPGARNSECFRLAELAEKLGMFVTAGSDFHGKSVRSDRHIGRTIGNRKIEDKFWDEELKPALGGNFDFKNTDFF